MKTQELRRRLRRFHRILPMVFLTLYVVSGIAMFAGMDSPRIQGCLHIALGIAHVLA